MLKELFDKYGCDKGTGRHHYYKEYEPYMKPVREELLGRGPSTNDPINILEIGTFKGASTRAFHEYFPKANIYVIDLFDRIPSKDVTILRKDRVRFIESNSTVRSLPNKIKKAWGTDIKFDFIIDDGAHWPEANRLTFENTIEFLKPDGTYFVEDVWPLHLMTPTQLLDKYLVKNPGRYDMDKHLQMMDVFKKYDITSYDRREETRRGDTYIIAMKHKK